jgi:hypothetical protein
VKIQRNIMKTKLLLKKAFIFAIAIVSMCASQNTSAMTTTALRTAGTASKNLYKAIPKRAYHNILEVGPNATKAEVEAAYQLKVKEFDLDMHKSADAIKHMKEINRAIKKARITNYASADTIQASHGLLTDLTLIVTEFAAAGTEFAAVGTELIIAGGAIAAGFIYKAFSKLTSQDNIDNNQTIPIPQANEQVSNTSQAPTISEPILQTNQQAPSMWTNIAENSTEFITQNPAITAITAAAIISTAAYYAYKYITAPKKEEAIDQSNTEVNKDEQADNNITALDDTEEPS